jgi:HAD superfamily hydrolase (TIGR01549 family)
VARALLLDALGTLVRLDDPVGRLAAALRARGVEVSPRAAAHAMRAEIAYYRAEHDRAGTRAGLELLRDDCAAVVERELATGLPAAELRAALLEAIRFVPFAEVEHALDRFAARGVALAVVSNWDVSLHDVLDELGWTARFGAVVTSAELGIAKPDPRPFAVALAALGVAARDAVHVGDDYDADIRGARAAGVRGLLLVRDGDPGLRSGVELVRSLDEVVL